MVAGHDSAGTFYGAQTLLQLLGHDAQGVFVPAAQVDDYPTLPWRGAHLFLGSHALLFHKKLIANILARFKMNNLVLECEQAQWETLGQHVPAWAMSKADLTQEIAFARRYHLAVTPLVESVGHIGWLVRDPAYGSLAEDPQTPYAANPINPKTYALLNRLYDEVEDTFHAPMLCIGGDEVTQRGRYPFRSRGRYPTVADAFVAHVTRLHDDLNGRDVRTMLWGDMLLAPGEATGDANAPSLADAQQMRARLPKDILIADWRYGANDDFASPQIFQSSGFGPVIGATWDDPRDIARFAQSLAAAHQAGLLQTTWAGTIPARKTCSMSGVSSSPSSSPPNTPGVGAQRPRTNCPTTRLKYLTPPITRPDTTLKDLRRRLVKGNVRQENISDANEPLAPLSGRPLADGGRPRPGAGGHRAALPLREAVVSEGLTAHGHAELKVKPDIARFTVSVTTQAGQQAAAAQDNARRTTTLLAALKAAGVADKDIQTQSYNVQPQYDYKPSPPVLTGFQVDEQHPGDGAGLEQGGDDSGQGHAVRGDRRERIDV